MNHITDHPHAIDSHPQGTSKCMHESSNSVKFKILGMRVGVQAMPHCGGYSRTPVRPARDGIPAALGSEAARARRS